MTASVGSSAGKGTKGLRGPIGAALAVLVLGFAALALRPPIPFDETRYLEVARELHGSQPLLLALNSEPYSHKPPLAFWLAHLLAFSGLPLEIALRALPALSTAACALAVERIARRAGLRNAAWLFAAQLLPALYAQALLVDPLLCACVWWSLEAWTGERDGRATVFAALAFLAKGPVAALHLVPFAWALAPLRARGRTWRVLAVALVGAIPLAAWALYSAYAGGEVFARELLVEQTSGRLVESFAHKRSALIYAGTIAVGALPVLPALLLGMPAGPLRRLPAALGFIVLCFALISGKQPHYLLPIFPAIALWASELLGRNERGAERLRLATAAFAALAFVALAAAPWIAGTFVRDRMDTELEAQLRDVPALVLWVAGLSALAFAGVRAWRAPARAETTCSLLLLALGGLLLPAHFVAGRLTFPRDLARALRASPNAPLVGYHAYHFGLLNYLGQRDRVELVRTPEELAQWTAAHPGGLVVLPVDREADAPGDLVDVLLRDHIRGRAFELRRVRVGAD
jgi:4-amino-4-deoxy-L-arabinose transferase-like glycosyltransferase